MFKYGISCSLEPQPKSAPTHHYGDIETTCSEIKRAGYDAIELFIRDAKQYDANRINAAMKAAGLDGCCAICTGMEYTKNHLCLISDDAANRRAAIDALKAHIDLGAQIGGAPVVVGIMRGNIPDMSKKDMYLGWYKEALAELCDYGKSCGVDIYVESIMRYINNYLNSVPEAAQFLREMEKDNLFLHIDTHSMNVEDKDEYSRVMDAMDIIGYVHFSDSDRSYPGGGNIDFGPTMQALVDGEYQGYISTECWPHPSEFECAKRGLDFCRGLELLCRVNPEIDE